MQRNFIDEIKHIYKTGGGHIQLLAVNTAVFLFIGIIEVFSRLIGPQAEYSASRFLTRMFSMPTDSDLLFYPWTFVTSIFAHYDFMHFVLNMLFLFFVGRIFEQHFNRTRLIYTYVLAGFAGSLLEILAHTIFPTVAQQSSLVVGASGSIMGVFVALAFYAPRLQVNLFGLLPVRLIFLALFFVLSDFFALGTTDGTAHFAHLGGALFGVWSVQNYGSPKNIVSRFIKWFDSFFARVRGFFSKKKMTVVSNQGRPKTDEEFLNEKKQNQETIDRILDKISKAGYDSLTKEEKNILFKQSQK